MADAILFDSKLRLNFDVGMNEKGEPIFKSKTIGNVKRAATADELYQFAQAIATLSSDPLSTIVRTDSSDING